MIFTASGRCTTSAISDRSILFWKSLPVSDVTTVIAKASIPILILPLITFAVLVVTQGIMLLAGGAALLGRGAGEAAAPWTQMPILPLWTAMLYHLLTVHALYYAPIYGWLLLVSAWARRAPILWASLPVAAILIVERLVFNTSAFGHMLLARPGGRPGGHRVPAAREHAHTDADAGQSGGIPGEPGPVDRTGGMRGVSGRRGAGAQIPGTDLIR